MDFWTTIKQWGFFPIATLLFVVVAICFTLWTGGDLTLMFFAAIALLVVLAVMGASGVAGIIVTTVAIIAALVGFGLMVDTATMKNKVRNNKRAITSTAGQQASDQSDGTQFDVIKNTITSPVTAEAWFTLFAKNGDVARRMEAQILWANLCGPDPVCRAAVYEKTDQIIKSLGIDSTTSGNNIPSPTNPSPKDAEAVRVAKACTIHNWSTFTGSVMKMPSVSFNFSGWHWIPKGERWTPDMATVGVHDFVWCDENGVDQDFNNAKNGQERAVARGFSSGGVLIKVRLDPNIPNQPRVVQLVWNKR